MYVFLIIVSCLLWALATVALFKRLVAAPALSFLGLLAISAAARDGVPILPLNATLLTGWLCMTLVVTIATSMQPAPLRAQSRGMGYIVAGAFTGMAVGLLGFTFSASLSLLYAVMVTATVAGTFFGFLLFANTPDGKGVAPASGNFFKYLLAKGFPTAITVMQIGVVIVIALALHNLG